MVFVGERGQGGLFQVLSAGIVGNLVRRHRAAVLESVQLLVHDHCLGLVEVEANVLEVRYFSAHTIKQYDARFKSTALWAREGNHLLW